MAACWLVIFRSLMTLQVGDAAAVLTQQLFQLGSDIGVGDRSKREDVRRGDYLKRRKTRKKICGKFVKSTVPQIEAAACGSVEDSTSDHTTVVPVIKA